MPEEAERGSMEEFTDINEDMEKLMEAKRTILNKPDGRQGKSKESDKGELETINKDLENVAKAENDNNYEDTEGALIKFYEDRQKLKEEGIDESILKKYEEKVDGILETEKLNKNKRLVDSDKFDESDMLEEAERGSMEEFTDINEDMEKLMEAKRTHDDKGVEAAFASLYEHGNTLKEKGVLDDSDLKEIDRRWKYTKRK